MININLRLTLPVTTFETGAVVTVYFKSRTNIVGTCSLEKNDSGVIGSFNIAEELHDDLYVLYIYSAVKDDSILEGILFDDNPHNKSINTVGSIKLT